MLQEQEHGSQGVMLDAPAMGTGTRRLRMPGGEPSFSSELPHPCAHSQAHVGCSKSQAVFLPFACPFQRDPQGQLQGFQNVAFFRPTFPHHFLRSQDPQKFGESSQAGKPEGQGWGEMVLGSVGQGVSPRVQGRQSCAQTTASATSGSDLLQQEVPSCACPKKLISSSFPLPLWQG